MPDPTAAGIRQKDAAYHEAGHAIGEVLWCERRLEKVAIGEESYSQPRDDPHALLPRWSKHARMLIAGLVASHLASDNAADPDWWDIFARHLIRDPRTDSDESRFAWVVRTIIGVTGAEAEDFACASVERTAWDLTDAWPAVDALAAALFDRGTVDGLEAERIIQSALPGWPGLDHLGS